jgi:hypothetical protein
MKVNVGIEGFVLLGRRLPTSGTELVDRFFEAVDERL